MFVEQESEETEDAAQQEVVDEPHQLFQQQLKKANDDKAKLMKEMSQLFISFFDYYFTVVLLVCFSMQLYYRLFN